ncbi:MAG TPA: hypothetical protein VFO98_00405 [Marmoricola sp.]|nr:hypothetical protein [Marmoricola sp.]
MTDLVLVPSPPALLAAYPSRIDPLPEVRRAAAEAVRWLVERSEELVVVSAPDTSGQLRTRPPVPAGLRIARNLLGPTPPPATEVVVEPGTTVPRPRPGCGVLVVADGSARRSTRAPGHLDERSIAFDDDVEQALRSGDPQRFAALDPAVAAELLSGAVPVLSAVGTAVAGRRPREVALDLSADPFGVQYWVARWIDLA